MLPTMSWPTWSATPRSSATASSAWPHLPLPTGSPRSCRLRRGVTVTATDAGVHVALYVVIEYGTNINTVSQNLVDQVTFVLKEYARVPLDGVEVHVQGVKVRK